MSLLSVMDKASPVGPIPDNYPYLAELCKAAHIGYKHCRQRVIQKVRTVDANGKPLISDDIQERTWRDWHVCYDVKMYPRRRKTTTGKVILDNNQLCKGTMEHKKFCAILDYIQWRASGIMLGASIVGRVDWANILNIAIGKDRDLILPNGDRVEVGSKVSELRQKDFRAIAKELSGLGLREYDSMAMTNSAADDLPF